MVSPAAEVERVARTSYGRLVAFLSRQSRDVAAAEDALADAFRIALERWGETGVPVSPEAWLMTTARRRLIDSGRRRETAQAALSLLPLLSVGDHLGGEVDRLPDWRLELMFACAHPAIDPAVHAPLMLQVVLGFDAAAIAAAFLVAPATMGQRLSRAKAKIKAAGIAFEIPESGRLAERLAGVLDAIYVAFGAAQDDIAGADLRMRWLGEEALSLARVVDGLLPDQPEVKGLLALMLHGTARRKARFHPEIGYVPLDAQDVALWDAGMIAEAERLLLAASRFGVPGRFQLEAAIQSAHACRRLGSVVPDDAMILLYDGLVALAPSVGALVGRLACLLAMDDLDRAGQALAAIDESLAADYQPYWAARAAFHDRLGQVEQADRAYDRALCLATDPAVRAFLGERRRAMLGRRV
ncbi:RNA polymerase sigma factor [Oryzibacter oryziterrae]|uniref:RNA polymerase sigma factor n=1 Tax=Oryzibacter oryziterrae TaxID=2766474 RepID=UPI001F19E401|nr:DUF6596 domain-containing protein [Oryzibacter oryziterrae]